ncbi:MAG: hypothetical protein ABSE63_01065 [Thermoguttaceae bacterium]
MARIGSALTGIERRLLNSLALANAQVTLSSYRMATGHKIKGSSDDPSASVALSAIAGLTVVNQQRLSIVKMLQEIAGLKQT